MARKPTRKNDGSKPKPAESVRKPVKNTVQYRTGSSFARSLDVEAKKWKVSRHEAAKRLASLAINGLSIRHYDLVLGCMKEPQESGDFVGLCESIGATLKGVERGQIRAGGSPMTPEERESEIQRIVSELASG